MLVKTLRTKNHWSQEHLAQLSGLNIRTVQRVEKGESVGIETLKSLAAVFELDVEDLKSERCKDFECQKAHADESSLISFTKNQQKAEAEVESKMGFYILSLFLLGTFIFFLLPNYNQGENLGALLAVAASFAMIIGAHAIFVFQPFGDRWKKKKIKAAIDKYKEEVEPD